MNANDLISEFRVGYDLAASGLPGFEDEDILSFIETSQYKLISQKFGGNNVYGQGFPGSKKSIDDLIYTISSSEVSLLGSTNGYRLMLLPDNYLHIVELIVLHPEGPESAIQVDYSKIPRFQNSKRNQEVYIKNPVYVFDKSASTAALRVYIDSSYSSTTTAKLLYISRPTVNFNTSGLDLEMDLVDFNDDVYHEIVRLAIDEAIFAVTPNKSQISQQQLNKTE